MKKAVLVTLVASLASGSVFAGGMDFSGLDKLNTPVGMTTFGIGATSYAPTASAEGTTNSFKNDIVNVQGDAVVALETGVVSPELQSVIAKVRNEVPELAGASDEQIVQAIVEQK